MTPFNPAVDEYMAGCGDFAKPVFKHLRLLIHNTCPEVVEIMKWGIPHFDYKGEMMCIFAAYSQHCSFSFWKADLMNDPRLKQNSQLKAPQRYLGKITKLSDLPPDDELAAFITEAMVLNEQGIKIPRPKAEKPKEIEMPDYFAAALVGNPPAKEVFESKPQSFRKEYLVWITDAKTEATRQKRIDEALSWIAEGKGRFWKYEK